MRILLGPALLSILMLTTTARGETSVTDVASGRSPTIDGTLAADEWEDARTIDLRPEGEALLMQDAESLYVGVRVGQGCLVSLALLHDDRVLVLHASASLGTAVYERSGDVWTATRTFDWRCRDGQATDAERARFLADEGWLATTAGVGRSGETEIRIDRRLLGDASPRLAVVACRLRPTPPVACSWPETVRDDTRKHDLLFGKTPDLRFEPADWAMLDLGRAGCSADEFDAAVAALEEEPAPVPAYRALLALFEEHPEHAAESRRARRLRKRLERQEPVVREVAAERRLTSVVKLARKKLLEIEREYPGTRAARDARQRLDALEPRGRQREEDGETR